MDSIPATPKKEKVRIIKAFLIFTVQPNGHSDGNKIKAEIKFPIKISPKDEAEFDPDSVAMMCFPNGFDRNSDTLDSGQNSAKESSRFHSFVITRQDGSRLYGSTLVVHISSPTINHSHRAKAYCLLSTIPFVIPMNRLLTYFHESKCEPSSLVQRICNLKVPSKGKYLKLMLPPVPRNVGSFDSQPWNGSAGHHPREVFIYRGTTEYPIFDYQLRELFSTVLSPANFLLALSAVLLEYQILIISRDFNKLMMVGESLICLLHPFKWQHVYVPILPSKLGLSYLDAPTPYIMGLTSCPGENQDSMEKVSLIFQSLPSISSNQCHVFCDDDRVEHVQGGVDHPWNSCLPERNDSSSIASNPVSKNESNSFILPPFYQPLLESVNKLLSSTVNDKSRSSSNEVVSNVVKIRDNNIVAIEKVIKPSNNPFHSEQGMNLDGGNDYVADLVFNQSIRMVFREMIQSCLLGNFEKFLVASPSKSHSCTFDSVSHLIDQPEENRKFLSRFYETQMFATFIDEVGSKNKSRFDPSQFDSCDHQFNISVIGTGNPFEKSTDQDAVNLLSSVNKVFTEAIEDATCVDLNETNPAKSCYSPRAQRKVYDGIKTDGNRLFSPKKERFLNMSPAKSIDQYGIMNDEEMLIATFDTYDLQDGSRNVPSALAAHTNWTVVESLLKETRNKTKRIVLENIADRDHYGSDRYLSLESSSDVMLGGNALITSLCDLIERIWIHGRLNDRNRLVNGSSSFWSYVIQYCHRQRDVVSSNQSTLLLVFDVRTILQMMDIKSDIGRARSLIRLALEKKMLSIHIRTILSDQDLLTSSYRRYAFLRCEEEREQFLAYLLTLSAVDLPCFTMFFREAKPSIVSEKMLLEKKERRNRKRWSGSKPNCTWQ